MNGDMTSLDEKNKRRKARVKNLKRLIVAVTVTAVILPTVFCAYLMVKMDSIQDRMDDIETMILKQSEETKRLAQQEAAAQEEALSLELKDGVYATELGSESEADNKESDKTVAYLTFDDGPSENTGAILDILASYDIKATFFVVGKETDEAKELYKRIVDEGHTLGMHSYSHKYSVIYDSVEAFSSDVHKLQDLLVGVTGYKPELYRFPGGSSNLVSNISMTEFIKYLNQEDITYFDWNVASGDATSQNVDVDTLVENVMNDVELYKTSVILMHDGVNKVTSVEALPIIIERLKEAGIEMKPIDSSVPHVQHIRAETVNN